MTEAGILINLTVDSIERELQAVERAGGQVVQRRQLIAGDVGWWAHFRDPSGNLLALFEPAQKAE